MNSEVKVSTTRQGIKLTFVIGLALSVIVIWLSVAFSPLFWAGGAVVVGLIALGGVSKIVVFTAKNSMMLYGAYLDLRAKKYEVDKLALERHIISFPKSHRQLTREPDIRVIDMPLLEQSTPPPVAMLPHKAAGLTPIMSILSHESQPCFFGSRGSGKTNLALHWLNQYQGEAVIIDPKGRAMNLWPERFKVVSDVATMQAVALEFVNDMEQHRQDSVVCQRPKLLFVDELKYLLTQHALDLMPFIMDIATFGREYGFDAAFTTHGATVKHLGIDAASLLENFVMVKGVKDAGHYRCFVVGANGHETEHAPPAAYPKPVLTVKPHTNEETPPGPTFSSDEEKRIFDTITDYHGASYGQIAKLATLSGSRPTTNKKIKAVIETFGLDHCNIGAKFGA